MATDVPHRHATRVLAESLGKPSLWVIISAPWYETIIRSGQADPVALGRTMLFDPHWPWHAAEELRAQAAYPAQYQRSHPSRLGVPVPGNPPPPRP